MVTLLLRDPGHLGPHMGYNMGHLTWPDLPFKKMPYMSRGGVRGGIVIIHEHKCYMNQIHNNKNLLPVPFGAKLSTGVIAYSFCVSILVYHHGWTVNMVLSYLVGFELQSAKTHQISGPGAPNGFWLVSVSSFPNVCYSIKCILRYLFALFFALCLD